MRRNTALRLVAWLGVFGLAIYRPVFHELLYRIWATVAHRGYDFPVPATASELIQFMEANPDAKSVSSIIIFGILIALAGLIGSILVALFGEAKTDKAAEK